MIAINTAGIVLIGLGLLVVALFVGLMAVRHRAKGTRPEVPLTMRPGPSDAALETPLLNKLQGWGVVLILFFVAWFPIVWLMEPSTNLEQEEALRTLALERGHRAVLPFSEENQLGVGCTGCHGPELRGGVIQTATGFAYPPDLTNLCAGPFGTPAHSAIFSTEDIYQVIEEGRPADDPVMPSWSIRNRGALTDQQINDIVVYLVSLSEETVPFEDNVCLNKEASERALEQNDPANGGPGLNPRDP